MVLLSESLSALRWSLSSGSTDTAGVESTPQAPLVEKYVRPRRELPPGRLSNVWLSASRTTFHLVGCAESTGEGSSSHAAESCKGGRLQTMLRLRSSTNSMLVCSSLER